MTLVSTPGWVGVHPHCFSGPSLTAERVWLPSCPLEIVNAWLLDEIAVFVPLVTSYIRYEVVSGDFIKEVCEFCLPSEQDTLYPI